MLTRCKVAMFICCNMKLLQNTASDTLLGKLATKWNDYGVPLVDPLKEVNWSTLFEKLKKNTSKRLAMPRGKGKNFDLSKIKYGTAIKKGAIDEKSQESEQWTSFQRIEGEEEMANDAIQVESDSAVLEWGSQWQSDSW
jgi:hypothetical protein